MNSLIPWVYHQEHVASIGLSKPRLANKDDELAQADASQSATSAEPAAKQSRGAADGDDGEVGDADAAAAWRGPSADGQLPSVEVRVLRMSATHVWHARSRLHASCKARHHSLLSIGRFVWYCPAECHIF